MYSVVETLHATSVRRETKYFLGEMYEEIFAGLNQDPRQMIAPIKGEEYDEMVLVKEIPFYSDLKSTGLLKKIKKPKRSKKNK